MRYQNRNRSRKWMAHRFKASQSLPVVAEYPLERSSKLLVMYYGDQKDEMYMRHMHTYKPGAENTATGNIATKASKQ